MKVLQGLPVNGEGGRLKRNILEAPFALKGLDN